MSEDIAAILAGRHKLRIGESFAPVTKYTYHALRYDFKPASIDPNSPSSILVNGNEVTVVPDGEKSQTVFKGNKRPCLKEGVLIFDPSTGECTLERLNNIVQVKKSRDVAARSIPQINTESSLDSSPKHSSATDRKYMPTKQNDQKKATLPSKKPSPNPNSSSVPSRVPVTSGHSRSSAPIGRINVLKDDLNLSESSDDE